MLIKQPRSRRQRSETPVGVHLQIVARQNLSGNFEMECLLERVGCHVEYSADRCGTALRLLWLACYLRGCMDIEDLEGLEFS